MTHSPLPILDRRVLLASLAAMAATPVLAAPAKRGVVTILGDSIAAGLARLDFSVQPDTDVCVVALGGNDLLQGQDTRASKANLDKIVRRLKARRIGVVVAGLVAPPQIGRGYARDYDAMFPAVARAEGVALC